MKSKKRYTPSVSLTSSQKNQLEKKANELGLKYTVYMREVALGNIPQNEDLFSKYEYTAALKEVRREVLLVGNNVNQLARVANTTGSINPKRVDGLQEQLIAIRNRITEELQ